MDTKFLMLNNIIQIQKNTYHIIWHVSSKKNTELIEIKPWTIATIEGRSVMFKGTELQLDWIKKVEWFTILHSTIADSISYLKWAIQVFLL